MPRLNPFAQGRTRLTKLWDASIDGHVISIAWSAALELLAAASVDGPIALFDAKTGQVRFHLLGHGFGTSCVAWSADGLHLASAGQDGKVRLWDATTGQQIREMPGGAAWVERIAWCPISPPSPSGRGAGGEGILASAAGKKLRQWNFDGSMLREYADHPSTITDIQWQPKTAILASTAYGKLYLWDCLPFPSGTETGGQCEAPANLPLSSHSESAYGKDEVSGASALTPGPSPKGRVEALREFSWQGSMLTLAWSPNAEYVAAGGQDCSVHFWLMKTGKDLQMSGYPVKVRELSWDATSRYLATGGGAVPCVWDCSGKGPAGTQPIQLDAHKDHVTCLTYQHRGNLLASGGEDGLVALWQPGQQQGPLAIAKHAGPVSQLLWADDDRRLVVGTADGRVLVYAT